MRPDHPLADLLGAAAEVREFAIARLQDGAPEINLRMFCAYAAILMELHKAICNLMEHDLPTGAFALERSLLEAADRGLWVLLCASEIQAGLVLVDAKVFPAYAEMAEQVEERLGIETDQSAIRGLWRELCGSAHSGAIQLGRHMQHTGRIGPAVQVRDAQIMIRRATSQMLLVAVIQIERMGNEAVASEVDQFYDRFPILRQQP